MSVMAIPSTASPRNSSRSLVLCCGISFSNANDRWVSAVFSSPGSLKRTFSAFSSGVALRGTGVPAYSTSTAWRPR